jgi:hypothetical protein
MLDKGKRFDMLAADAGEGFQAHVAGFDTVPRAQGRDSSELKYS